MNNPLRNPVPSATLVHVVRTFLYLTLFVSSRWGNEDCLIVKATKAC